MSGSIVIEEAFSPVYVVTFTGSVPDAEFDRYLDALSRLTERGGRRALVYDTRLARPSPASQRRKQADWMQRYDAQVRQSTAGIAFVLTSPLMRGALTAILWLQPLACPHHVTPDFESGMRWARTQLAQMLPRSAAPDRSRSKAR